MKTELLQLEQTQITLTGQPTLYLDCCQLVYNLYRMSTTTTTIIITFVSLNETKTKKRINEPFTLSILDYYTSF